MAAYGRPSSDVYNSGDWKNELGGGTNIYQSIDEAVASDSDYAKTDFVGPWTTYVVQLSSMADPTVHTGHVIRYRYKKDPSAGSQPGNLTVELREGYTIPASPGTLIHQEVHTDIPATWTNGSFTLTTGEAGNITDYSDLQLLFRVTPT